MSNEDADNAAEPKQNPSAETVTDNQHIPTPGIEPGSQSNPEQESVTPPQQFDEVPALLPEDATENQRIERANLLVAQCLRFQRSKTRGTYLAFRADLAIIPRIRALKETIGGDAFIEQAYIAGVSKNDAYNIVNTELADPQTLRDIEDGAEVERRQAESRGQPYFYPDLKAMLKKYRPPPTPSGTKDAVDVVVPDLAEALTEIEETLNKPNRTLKEYRAEAQRLEAENSDLQTKLVFTRDQLRDTEAQLARHRQTAAERLMQVEQLREQLAAEKQAKQALRDQVDALQRGDNVIRAQFRSDKTETETGIQQDQESESEAKQQSETEQTEREQQQQDAMCPGTMAQEAIHTVESRNKLKGFKRGTQSADSWTARAVRAEFIAACEARNIPVGTLPNDPTWWREHRGKTASEVADAISAS